MRTGILFVAFIAAASAGIAEAAERIVPVKVTCSNAVPGTVYQVNAWAYPGLTNGTGAIYVMIERNAEKMTPVFRKLMDEGTIPPGIALFFGPGSVPAPTKEGASRWMRPAHFDQPGPDFPTAIAEDLVPAAEAALGVKAGRDPNLNLVWGASSGGIAAFNACWYRNDFFRRCACFSPTFANVRGGHRLLPLVRKCEPRPIRVWTTSATVEPDHFFGDSYCAAEDAASALRFAGYAVRFARFEHKNHGFNASNVEYMPTVLSWLYADWRTKPVRVRRRPFRVKGVTAEYPTWKPSAHQLPPPVRKVVSTDRWRLYSVSPTNRFVMSERLSADGSRDRPVRLAPMDLAWDFREVGGRALAQDSNGRLFVATELGVQSVVTAGIVDCVLPLPGDLPCDNVTLEGRMLYASSGTNVFERQVICASADPNVFERPDTPHYWDGRSREHEPQGGVNELLGSAWVGKFVEGALSVVTNAAGQETARVQIGAAKGASRVYTSPASDGGTRTLTVWGGSREDGDDLAEEWRFQLDHESND